MSRLVAGEPVSGSWWGHPMGHEIFAMSEALDDDEHVITAKLVAGKVTFIHRSLWPALLGVAQSGEYWQMRGLSRGAAALLRRIDAEGELRTDALAAGGGTAAKRTSAKLVGELESRLLAHTAQFHTESGKHAKRLQSWTCFVQRRAPGLQALAPARARAAIQDAAARLSAGKRPRLPWDA